MTAHNITAAELEKLLAEVTPGEWEASPGHEQRNGQRYWQIQNEYDAIMQNQFCWAQGSHEANARLIAMAPTLARKVIAAEKLAELMRDNLEDGAITEWQTAALVALAEYEAAQ